MKKTAFSYLELMIAMTLVVIVAILTAPVMTSMGKKPTPMYGEYKCYARLVLDKNVWVWKLYENERVNADSYPVEDTEVTRKNAQGYKYCKFTKPVGNISSYSVKIVGGGGSGSMPYFVSKVGNDTISLAPGGSGKNGDEKSVVDSLAKAFETDGSMNIFFCDENSTKNCVGKGGDTVKSATSMAPKERVDKIKNKLKTSPCLISSSDEDYLENCSTCNISVELTSYKNNQNCTTAKNLANHLTTYPQDNVKYTGSSGKSSQIMLSDNKTAVAMGGEYGIADKYTNSKSFAKMAGFTVMDNNFYHYPANPIPDVSGTVFEKCNGDDANNPSDIETYENFGAGGGGGCFVCKIPNVNNLGSDFEVKSGSIKDIKNNRCYQGYGGAGAGGAIIIQWN